MERAVERLEEKAESDPISYINQYLYGGVLLRESVEQAAIEAALRCHSYTVSDLKEMRDVYGQKIRRAEKYDNRASPMLGVLVGLCGVVLAGYTVLIPSASTITFSHVLFMLLFFAILIGMVSGITQYSKQSFRSQEKIRKYTMVYNALSVEILRRSKN